MQTKNHCLQTER